MLFLQMSLEKVNDGFEGDQKTLVKERDVSLEEGKGGDDGNQVTMMMLVVVVRVLRVVVVRVMMAREKTMATR